MNILDKNIIDNQRRQLKSWRITVRQIGYEVGKKKSLSLPAVCFAIKHSKQKPSVWEK